MGKSSLLRFVVLFVICVLVGVPGISTAVDLGSFGDRIFQFQKKLAQNGNKLAQYKLGTLYEFGVSVEPNMEAAREWYHKAASQDYEPAVNRLTYLDVKQNGFDEDKHGEWMKRVFQRVDENEADALILLGQMNRHGIVVDKNLNLAVGLLQRASSLGHTEVDSQIDELKREILDKKAAKKARKVKKAQKPKVAKKKSRPATTKKVSKKSSSNNARKKAEREAKRQRYQEAMRKFYKETLLLQQQQEWAESVAPVE